MNINPRGLQVRDDRPRELQDLGCEAFKALECPRADG
jgi:hypothetical protein